MDKEAQHPQGGSTWPGWWAIGKEVWQELGKDNVSVLAAGVAFYALLSIFPALTALISLYGLVADPAAVEQQVSALQGVVPSEALSLVSQWLRTLLRRPPSTFSTGLILSLSLSLWSARYATGAMMTALNVAYDKPESRGLIWFNVVAFGLALVLILFGALPSGWWPCSRPQSVCCHCQLACGASSGWCDGQSLRR